MVIKPIENTEKRMSQYELGKALEELAKFLNELPLCVIRNVEFQEDEAYTRIDNLIKNINARLLKLQESINLSEQSIYDAGEEHYRKTRDAVTSLNKRLAELPEIKDAPRIPYNVKELVDTAERLSHLTPEQWQRVLDLAAIFAKQIFRRVIVQRGPQGLFQRLCATVRPIANRCVSRSHIPHALDKKVVELCNISRPRLYSIPLHNFFLIHTGIPLPTNFLHQYKHFSTM